ncbi:MAG: type I restriction enzyme HsdR N-terminal domain-containing protein [Duncaniella sp.]|nr:type I restriction enzyme HsdR N-terminal domain-containing protein [Duncaniella sp.]
MPSPLQSAPPRLNLPAARLEMRPSAKGVEVYDVLRKKWILLTAEEWVRQHFVHYLTDTLGYPSSFMANEVGISLNGTSRRCDTVIYTPGLRPVAIVEYKAADVAITRAVFDQIVRYNIVLRVPYLIISNGMVHHCFRVSSDGTAATALSAMPTYQQLIGG